MAERVGEQVPAEQQKAPVQVGESIVAESGDGPVAALQIGGSVASEQQAEEAMAAEVLKVKISEHRNHLLNDGWAEALDLALYTCIKFLAVLAQGASTKHNISNLKHGVNLLINDQGPS